MRRLYWTHQVAAIIACVGMISPAHHLQAEEDCIRFASGGTNWGPDNLGCSHG